MILEINRSGSDLPLAVLKTYMNMDIDNGHDFQVESIQNSVPPTCGLTIKVSSLISLALSLARLDNHCSQFNLAHRVLGRIKYGRDIT